MRTLTLEAGSRDGRVSGRLPPSGFLDYQRPVVAADSHNYEPIAGREDRLHDPRWIRIRRPLVVVGGELTIEAMASSTAGRSGSAKRRFR